MPSWPCEFAARDHSARPAEQVTGDLDAVERGESFTITRDGYRIGELIPLRHQRRFVTRQEFAAMSRKSPAVDLEAFRADQDATADHGQSLSPKLTHLCSAVLSHGEGCARSGGAEESWLG